VWRGTFVLGSSSDVLLRTLPEVLCIATTGPAEGDLAWLRGLIGMMHAEADQPRPG
jgi:AraC family transcriptional activator of mtrCDE